jgi:alcohol dehydrogenase class IV
MNTFQYTTHAQEVVFSPGSVRRLGDLTDRFGWRRVLVCTTAHSRLRGHLAAVEEALGHRLAATYEDVQPHVPESQVRQAVAIAAEHRIVAVIGLGGGSAIGTAKAVGAALGEHGTDQQLRAESTAERIRVAVVAIPTTYAGSEMTPVFGVTRYENGTSRKVTTSDPGVVPQLVLYDPLLTLDLPPRVTAGTGINAMAHCIEALYSISRNPLSTAAALAGLQATAQALPRCYATGDDAEARAEMLAGAFLAGTALSNVAMGLHHGICHVLGGATGAAHGDLNAVMLPHVIRFNLDATAPLLAPAAEAMGLASAGLSVQAATEAVARRVADWVAAMRLPNRLRELGVREEQLPEFARMAFVNRTVQNNPKRIVDEAQLGALLRQAW